jgi:hypothetical protein
MKYLLLLANSSIYEHALNNAFHRFFNINQLINTKILFIKVYHGIIDSKFDNILINQKLHINKENI